MVNVYVVMMEVPIFYVVVYVGVVLYVLVVQWSGFCTMPIEGASQTDFNDSLFTTVLDTTLTRSLKITLAKFIVHIFTIQAL